MNNPIVIIGGGISGLAALEHITRVAPTQPVVLLERSGRLGGHIRTDCVDGFVVEAGPDVLLAAKPAALELAARVGIGDRVTPTNPAASGSYIYRRGSLRRVPEGLTGLVPSRLALFVTSPLVSPAGKLRVALDYVLPPRRTNGDESIEQFVVRRLGREMYHNLVEPLLSGISAGDGARLGIDAMFPQLRAYEREHGGLIRGMLATKRRASAVGTSGSAPRRGAFASFPNGLEELVSAVERTVRARDPHGATVDIRLDARVVAITPGDPANVPANAGGARYAVLLSGGEHVAADAVILATPAYVTSSFVCVLDPDLANMLGAIEYASTATISLAYPVHAVFRPLDATGYVVPRIEGRPVVACTWVSSKFVGRAPADQALFRVFIGGAGRPDVAGMDREALLQIAQSELRDVVGVTGEPTLARVNVFPRAMPQYTVGHRARMAAIVERASALPGFALAGAVYGGVGIPDCVRSGIDAASRVLAEQPQGDRTPMRVSI